MLDRTKVLKWQLKPVLEKLYKLRQMSIGRVEAIELEPLAESIWKHWDSSKFDTNLLIKKNFCKLDSQEYFY